MVAFACIAVAARPLASGRHLSFAFRIDLSLSSILTGQLDDVQSSIWCDLVSWSIERPFANNKLGGAYRPSAIKTCTRLATSGSPPRPRSVLLSQPLKLRTRPCRPSIKDVGKSFWYIGPSPLIFHFLGMILCANSTHTPCFWNLNADFLFERSLACHVRPIKPELLLPLRRCRVVAAALLFLR